MRQLPASATGQEIEPRRGAELTPLERAVRRRNRRWLVAIAAPAVVLGAGALVAAIVAGSSAPPVRPVSVPTGYKAVNDGYFAYAVPSGWTQNSAYTDDVGDLDTQGRTGWAAEHIGPLTTRPSPGEAPPASFATFGEPEAVTYDLGSPEAIQVPGASVAYRYSLTRPGGFEATAIDAWQARSEAEIWLLVRSDPATTAAIVASLNG